MPVGSLIGPDPIRSPGLDDEMIKRYVKYQEKEERKSESEQQEFDF